MAIRSFSGSGERSFSFDRKRKPGSTRVGPKSNTRKGNKVDPTDRPHAYGDPISPREFRDSQDRGEKNPPRVPKATTQRRENRGEERPQRREERERSLPANGGTRTVEVIYVDKNGNVLENFSRGRTRYDNKHEMEEGHPTLTDIFIDIALRCLEVAIGAIAQEVATFFTMRRFYSPVRAGYNRPYRPRNRW